MFIYVNIFISTEDGIAEKLLLLKINLLIFITYLLSWYGELINTLYNSLLLYESKIGFSMGSCCICKISRVIMCCLNTLLKICLKKPNDWKVYCRFFFQSWCNTSVVILFRSEFYVICSAVVTDSKPLWKQIYFRLV